MACSMAPTVRLSILQLDHLATMTSGCLFSGLVSWYQQSTPVHSIFSTHGSNPPKPQEPLVLAFTGITILVLVSGDC